MTRSVFYNYIFTDLTNQIVHKMSTVKYINHVGASLYWTCNPSNEDSTYNFKYTWLKVSIMCLSIYLFTEL